MKVLRKEIPWSDPYNLFVLLKGDEPSFLLESLGRGRKTSRYSFIGITPKIIIRSKGKEIKVLHGNNTESVSCGNPFETVRDLLKRREVLHPRDIPPFAGGAVGYFGYDMVHLFEELPRRAQDDLQLPDTVLMIVDVIIAFDHMRKKVWIISIQDGSDERGEARCREQIGEIEQRMKRRYIPADTGRSGLRIKMVSNLTQKEYIDMVRRCKEYIAAGDIFQANLSQRLSVQIKGVDPLRLYGVLRKVNPSPFSAFIDTGEMQLVSSSPERLIRLYDDLVETRPIAGTRPRGRDPEENGVLQKQLLASEKERAEHIMLVDLERNDIGRVCRYGSVRVDEFMELESYSHVNHIVSNVVGEIESGRDAFDLIRAVFPGGTITGVPKIRCMEIIDELEPTTRGPYTGSIGYISYSGNMDLNIVIRTFIIKDGWAHIQVGAGIVADSDPEREYYETLYKAEALIKTLELI